MLSLLKRASAMPDTVSDAFELMVTEAELVKSAPAMIVISPAGGEVSYPIVSEYVTETFPASSMYCTSSVFVPSPDVSVRLAVIAKGTHDPHESPALRRRICTTADDASVAVR